SSWLARHGARNGCWQSPRHTRRLLRGIIDGPPRVRPEGAQVTRKCVPMIHVPDVQATAAWYETIGFRTVQTAGGEDGGLSFARLVYGDSEVMFNIGGVPSSARRREVDLYVYAEDVDRLHATLEDRVDIVEGP